eukprot:TRINITY_DN7300_c0_g1_i1.p1 TRINITY_DN7300_c0_g1~~TRINITY_DN7300_c0_g1_i1.p1  ORF type:complete len:218 (-),score=37.67 TRINITY_DN7300_c0_g1_i1:162-815(-)
MHSALATAEPHDAETTEIAVDLGNNRECSLRPPRVVGLAAVLLLCAAATLRTYSSGARTAAVAAASPPAPRAADFLQLDTSAAEPGGRSPRGADDAGGRAITLEDLMTEDFDCILQLYPTYVSNYSWSLNSVTKCGECHQGPTLQMRNEMSSMNIVTRSSAQVRLFRNEGCKEDSDGATEWSFDVPNEERGSLFTMVGVKLSDKNNRELTSFKCECR